MFNITAGQKHLWLADYYGVVECEYNNGKWLRFDDINKSALSRFGMCSAKGEVYFDVLTGAFHLGDTKLEIFYGPYNLTDTGRCDDVIQYKSAHTNYRANSVTPVHINEFAYGYKKKVTFDNYNFSLKFIHRLPGERPGSEYITIQIVVDSNMHHNLTIRQTRGNSVSETTYPAPLKANHAGRINLAINTQGG